MMTIAIILVILVLLGAIAFIVIKYFPKQEKIKDPLDLLIRDIKIHMKNTYPNIVIDYEKIDNIKNNIQGSSKELSIVEEVVFQFVKQNIDVEPKYFVPRDELWSTYEEFSLPFKGKFPKDFSKRKEIAYLKNEKQCTRCGKKISIDEVTIYLLKSLENGGTYHFENMVVSCYDCYRILNNKENATKIAKNLNVYENLLDKII